MISTWIGSVSVAGIAEGLSNAAAEASQHLLIADRHVRRILDPIEELFGREFPEFDPFPWGRKAFIRRLVRNILLAEPLVEDFARCFIGGTPEELASSFAFDRCVRRERLAEITSAGNP